MGTGDAPLISILLAVYEPNMDWLREQLASLNAQMYPNLRLYARDDCSPTVPFAEIEACFRECVAAFPYTLERNERNLGSNKTFERLTEEAEGEYFAYCDQDDVWLPEKLAALREAIEQERAAMAYCTVSVIDGAGRQIAATLKELRPRLRCVAGENLAETYFFRNCSPGCATLFRGEIARKALPFPERTVCDQWLAIIAAGKGRIALVDKPLVRYRQHGGNQTGVLIGVTDKASYRRVRLEPLAERLEFYERYFGANEALASFVRARLDGRLAQIWKGRVLCRMDAAFEIAMRFLPEPVFQMAVRKLR